MEEASPCLNHPSPTLNANGDEKNKSNDETLCQKFNLPENTAAAGEGCLFRLAHEACESSSGDSSWNSATSGIIDDGFIGGEPRTNNGPTGSPLIIYEPDKNNDDENNNHTSGGAPITKAAQQPAQNGIRKNGKVSRIPIRKGRKNVVHNKEPAPKSLRPAAKGATRARPSLDAGRRPPPTKDEGHGRVKVRQEKDGDLKGPDEVIELPPPPDTTSTLPYPPIIPEAELILEAPAEFLDRDRSPAEVGGRPTETDSLEAVQCADPIEDIACDSEVEAFGLLADISNLSLLDLNLNSDSDFFIMNGIQLESPSMLYDSNTDISAFPKPARRLSLLSPKPSTPVEFDRKSPEIPPRNLLNNICFNLKANDNRLLNNVKHTSEQNNKINGNEFEYLKDNNNDQLNEELNNTKNTFFNCNKDIILCANMTLINMEEKYKTDYKENISNSEDDLQTKVGDNKNADEVDSIHVTNSLEEFDSFEFSSSDSFQGTNIKENLASSDSSGERKDNLVNSVSVDNSVSETTNKDLPAESNKFSDLQSDNQVGGPARVGGARASIAAAATPPPASRSGSRCEAARDHGAGSRGPQARASPPAAAATGLCWRFRPDGRLVFDEEQAAPLTSRNINKRCESSRLKPLEHKLKEAGITDGYLQHDQHQPTDTQQPVPTGPVATDCSSQPAHPNNAYDANQNLVKPPSDDDEEDFLPDLADDEACEFDASAFLRDSDDADSDEDFVIVRRPTGAMRDTDAAKHNPDKENLKSLLKKPGRQKDRKGNRVVFNETKNEFFDADYIILIREECCAEYDDEDDEECDEPCTCHRPELVRLPCCEPGCGCGAGSEPPQPQPPSPKFAPPPEFVDAVALSPPEGYKDMAELERRGGAAGAAAAVCRECSQAHGAEDEEEDGEASPSDTEGECRCEDPVEREKTDQSQQTTPTTPPEELVSSPGRGYATEMPAGAAQQRPPPGGSPVAGILKGGRLWRQQTAEGAQLRVLEPPQQAISSDSAPSDDDCGPNRRSVRFNESAAGAGVGVATRPRDECDGAPGSPPREPAIPAPLPGADTPKAEAPAGATSPDATEMTLTFRLGHHVLISNNSLKPNSAVRQLFPCAKVDGEQQQYLVTAESLRAFEEAKRAKLPQLLQGDADESIRKAIERNALRRSLIRYEARGRKQPYKADNSLVERIKQLTCDVDNDVVDGKEKDSSTDASEDLPDSRASPPGEEARNSPEVIPITNKNQDKSFSPSSSSTTSSSSMSSSSTLNRNRPDNLPDIQNNIRRDKPSTLPDIGGPHHNFPLSVATHPDLAAAVASRAGATVDGPRRQFLQATLAPLTACVGVGVGIAGAGEEYYQLSTQAQFQADRASLASSGGGTEYSLEDIDEALREVDRRPTAPDVVAGTPAAPEPPQPIAMMNANTSNAPTNSTTTTTANDELAAFVKRDAGRIERIRKKYQPEAGTNSTRSSNADDDDEHDDYGFSRRPSVRGIKPRFGTTTEILQQIQNQLQQPAPAQQTQQHPQPPAQQQQQPQQRAAWPYYSEQPDNAKRGVNQNYAYVIPAQYRTVEEGLYQNCSGQRSNVNMYSAVVRVGCNDHYASLPRQRNGRPLSPPPTDVSRQYHQTMVYIPYDRIESYQPGAAPVSYYHAADYARVANQNQINKRYIATPGYGPPGRPPPYTDGQPPPQHHHPPSRGGSPLPGQLGTARGTQTSAPPILPPTNNCTYYQTTPRYRPIVGPAWPADGTYATKINRHSFPVGLARYQGSDSASLTDSDSQHSGQLPNGFRQSADMSHYQKEHIVYQRDSAPGSPTKPRFIERGVPEGAASVSPQDGISQTSSGTMTSPTNPQNPPGQKPLFYAMNV